MIGRNHFPAFPHCEGKLSGVEGYAFYQAENGSETTFLAFVTHGIMSYYGKHTYENMVFKYTFSSLYGKHMYCNRGVKDFRHCSSRRAIPLNEL